MTTATEFNTKIANKAKPKVSVDSRLTREISDTLAVFNSRLDNAMIVGAGYRKSLYNALAVAYDLFVFFDSLSDEAKIVCIKVLKKRCVDEDITYSEKTKPEHAFIRLTFGDTAKQQNPHQVSQYARLLRFARDAKKTPEEFAGWIDSQGGIVKILNPNKVNQTSAETKKELEAFAKKAEVALKTKCIVSVASQDVDSTGIDSVSKDTPALAIVTRHKLGGFTVHSFVPNNEDLLNSAYVEIGRTL